MSEIEKPDCIQSMDLKRLTSRSKKEQYNSKDFLVGVTKQIQTFFENQSMCDVTLISAKDATKVGAHRMILSASSTYFFAMFAGGCREAEDKEVTFQVDGNPLKSVISFVYTGSIELAPDSVEEVLKAASLFQLSALEQICCDFIAAQLDPSNCLGITLFAEQYNYKKLHEVAEVFVCHNFMGVCESEEFLLLDIKQLCRFIARDELTIPSEGHVFHSLMNWIGHDETEREKYLAELFNHIRFQFLTPQFIAANVEVACKTIECERIVSKAYKWHLLPDFRLSLFPKEHSNLRNFEGIIFAISGFDNVTQNLSVGILSPSLNEWVCRVWPKLPEFRSKFGSTTFEGKWIVAGGKLVSGEISNRVDCLDLITLEWKTMPPLSVHRHSFGMITLNGTIYAVGGTGNSGPLCSVEKWTAKQSKWQPVASMPRFQPTNLCQTQVSAFLNSLNINIAKHTYYGNGNDHYIYNPITDSWAGNWLTTDGVLLGMGTVELHNKNYFIIVSRSSITKYDFSSTRSESFNSSIESKFTNCVVVNNRILVYGNNDFMEYDASSKEWKIMPLLNNSNGKLIVISN